MRLLLTLALLLVVQSVQLSALHRAGERRRATDDLVPLGAPGDFGLPGAYLGVSPRSGPLFPKSAQGGELISAGGLDSGTLSLEPDAKPLTEGASEDEDLPSPAEPDDTPGRLKPIDAQEAVKTCKLCPAEFLIRVRPPPALPVSPDNPQNYAEDKEAMSEMDRRISQRQQFVAQHTKWITDAQQAISSIQQELDGANGTKQNILNEIRNLQKEKGEIERKIKQRRLETDKEEAEAAQKRLNDRTAGLQVEETELLKAQAKADQQVQQLQRQLDTMKSAAVASGGGDALLGPDEDQVKEWARKAAGNA